VRGPAIVASLILFASHAHGDPAGSPSPPPYPTASVPGAPSVRWFDPLRVGDAIAMRQDGQAYGNAIFEPLRLALLAPSVPVGSMLAPCRDSVTSAGSVTASRPGFAPQYASALRLVPRLTLYGFSRGGCAVDTAVGGGMVYAQPIVPQKLWLVGSAGSIFLPRAGSLGAPVARTEARVDALVMRGDQHTMRFGIGTRGVSFGTSF
jgi:hypothetical protein